MTHKTTFQRLLDNISQAVLAAIQQGDVSDEDYIIVNIDSLDVSIGYMGVSDGSNRVGYELGFFFRCDEDGNIVYDKQAVESLCHIIEDEFFQSEK